ncbi:MAG: leucine-rich repeat protein [Lachnospiraceae bacterium]|nr:leucine-rich repeat protein [Lachnospiraceae bacterium]
MQAVEYDYPIEKTKEVQVLDENNMDSQGVKYTLDESTHTAMMGEQTANIEETTSAYRGANGGVCVVPERVSKDDIIYTVTSIVSGLFYRNSYLKTLVVADTVEKIGSLAVRDSYIQHIYIGSGVKEVVNAGNMFAGNSFLEDITVSDENMVYKDQDGILFTKDGKTLLCAPRLYPENSLTTYTVPDGVEVIGSESFNKTRYRKIVLPESVKKIETEAFENGYLTEIDLSHVNELYPNIFVGCKYLQNIVFPDSAWKVWGDGWALFGDGVNNVQYVYLKKDLAYGSYNHANCFRLKNLKTLVVENGITMIGKSEFQYTNLENVILPDGLKKIEENAFRNDPLLKRIYIPASVTSIGNNVLADNDTIIYGMAGSVAQSYAEEHDISFIDVSDHDHTNLPNKTVYEDLYTKVTADYCTECGYGTNVKQEIKAHEDIADGTNGAYDFSLEKTRRKVTLDTSLKDEQGVKYRLYEDSNVAYVDKIANDVNTKHIVIPEVVIWNNREYIVTTLFQSCIVSSSIESITLPNTIWQIYDQAFSSYSLKYIYLGAGVGNTALGMFHDKKNINGIWIAPGNAGYYVKDKVLYKNDGTVLCDYSGNTETSDATTEKPSSETTSSEEVSTATTEKDTSIEKPTTTEKDTGVEKPTTEKNTSVEKTSTERDTRVEDLTTTERDTSVGRENSSSEKSTEVATAKSNLLKCPKLKVKKKKTSAGVPYLHIMIKQAKGTYLELQVKKSNSKYKKIKLVSNRLKHYKGGLKIGYKPDGKKMWLRVRTYTKKKGKKYYSAWSKPVQVK